MKFISKKFRELRIVLVPGYRKIVGMTSELVPGVTVEFHNYEYQTNDMDIITALKAHPFYGVQIFSSEPEKDEPNIEGLRMENEKRAVAEELASQCPECGKQLKNSAGLEVHMRSHK